MQHNSHRVYDLEINYIIVGVGFHPHPQYIWRARRPATTALDIYIKSRYTVSVCIIHKYLQIVFAKDKNHYYFREEKL